MQREVEFRGISIDEYPLCAKRKGQFIYGDLIVHDDGSCGIHDREEDWYYEVNPDTVGQYTGLKDKNDIEIYEGDSIPYHFNNKKVGIVRYGEYHNPFDSDNHGGHAGFYLEWNEKDSLLRVDLCYWIKVSEVQGNFYENPELLNQPSTGTA
jgi:uncharacterized phage protein (TIGR01671 family)